MGGKKPPPVQGPSEADKARQADAEKRAKDRETAANQEIQSQSKAAYGRRTGRRTLLAPGREGGVASTLGGGSGTA